MAETYSKESLQGESRVSLRQIAMKELGMNARQISEMKSEAIIAAILEKQGGGGKKADKKDSPKDGKGSKAAPKEEPKQDEPEDEAEGSSSKQLDALGKAVDDVSEQISGLERQQYMLFGLLSDLWLAQCGGRDELKERIEELEKEFETEGND